MIYLKTYIASTIGLQRKVAAAIAVRDRVAPCVRVAVLLRDRLSDCLTSDASSLVHDKILKSLLLRSNIRSKVQFFLKIFLVSYKTINTMFFLVNIVARIFLYIF